MVMLTLSPFDEQKRFYNDPHEIDSSMYSRLKGKKFIQGRPDRTHRLREGGRP